MSSPATPNRHWQEVMAFFDSPLFIDVQCAGIFPDSKTFADATPIKPIATILSDYLALRAQPDFSLIEFVSANFTLPTSVNMKLGGDTPSCISDYIVRMWDVLTKPADAGNDYSLISLPHPYIVPGGRFREIYYWDTFFSALGLAHSGKTELVHHLIKNFLYIQSELGCIPNGNRLYYATRSQPPVLALMSRFADNADNQLQADLCAGLEHEYRFWMQQETGANGEATLRTVQIDNGTILNRYFDTSTTPRPESYREDSHLAEDFSDQDKGLFFQHIRAACESGWDFSSRWLSDPQSLSTIRTCDIIPVDLNCLLYQLERTLANNTTGDVAIQYSRSAQIRAEAIHQYCWSASRGYFMDYHFPSRQQTSVLSLAGVMPLFVGIATAEQARQVADMLYARFLCEGGLVTTVNTTSQQWDSPNGWAPLQWFAVKGLMQYGYNDLAQLIMQRWNSLMAAHFASHGVILEKYNVVNPASAVGGGEYEVQLGFGWSNGVYQDFECLMNSQSQCK
ncbi:trehalase family glycosidase [Alteromonas sp. AMM-1]|uniref:trehalase family glycosidase n=1 Tax=Alteromonas sp. AMM-1 TaxID=3394233 RepID=UPI0039A44CFD